MNVQEVCYNSSASFLPVYVSSYLIPDVFIIRRLVQNSGPYDTKNKTTVTTFTLKYKFV